MAIGLSRMFGFKCPENFNYPFISKSCTEYWRRWHMSLSSWFRDYVFFPLGGSRVSNKRLAFNLFVTWTLTGFWHGANWTFILWGFGYFILLSIEKFSGFFKAVEKASAALKEKFSFKNLFIVIFAHSYAVFFSVLLFQVLFRAPDLSTALDYFSLMFGIGNPSIDLNFWSEFKSIWIFLLLGIIFSMPAASFVKRKFALLWGTERSVTYMVIASVTCNLIYFALFILCVLSVVKSGYNPFIYFHF